MLGSLLLGSLLLESLLLGSLILERTHSIPDLWQISRIWVVRKWLRALRPGKSKLRWRDSIRKLCGMWLRYHWEMGYRWIARSGLRNNLVRRREKRRAKGRAKGRAKWNAWLTKMLSGRMPFWAFNVITTFLIRPSWTNIIWIRLLCN